VHSAAACSYTFHQNMSLLIALILPWVPSTAMFPRNFQDHACMHDYVGPVCRNRNKAPLPKQLAAVNRDRAHRKISESVMILTL
jgi:hypothetical protein